MTDEPITPVILCGGSGTRLWPLSRRTYPKQFVPLVAGKCLLEFTLERVGALGAQPVVVTGEEHRFLVTDMLERARMHGDIILEPVARNTAAAMALAALHARAREGDLLLFCPADHHIPSSSAFARTVRAGVPAALAGAIVTFGVQPTFPSSGYGYIEQGPARSDGAAHSVLRFIEKPDAASAEQLLLAGNMLWNAGIFLCRREVLIEGLQSHAADILSVCEQAMRTAAQDQAPSGHTFVRPDAGTFEGCRSQSIDFVLIEAADNVAVVPFDGAWSDVGSWNAVAQLQPADAAGNRIVGQGVAHDSHDTYIHAPCRTVVTLGTRNLLVIDTADAVLVADRGRAEEVKDVVAVLDQANRSEVIRHRKVARPWGWYDSVDVGERFQVKRIGVKPGASLSLQMHHHRAEHWVVVRGTAEVTCGTEKYLLTENQSTYIPIGQLHRLRNPGLVELELIEVQSGSYLGEDDIVRLEDTYGRGA